jgi:aspartyl-tRNA(Asn)/glutamyl-tRNA(Gln) amidotransferase subunit B
LQTGSFEVVIGLEVHAQLLTATKAFSPDSAEFGADPNQHVDVISLGHPGVLPVLNASVVEYTLRMGLATHCQIRPRSIFARKHYFYPDLPKGYQISQYDTPICHDGYVDIVVDPDEGEPYSKRIGLTRIHMEEDAGKSIHDQDPYDTLLDYNRCGVPLIEIVSEPDMRSPEEAYAYLSRIRQIVRYLGICDGNMEEGSLRCDANVSVRPRGQEAFGTRTEVKNMNSIRNVERALRYEIERQIALIESGGEVVQETLLWDASKLETRSLRSKEEAHDYRYFPEPDLAPVVVTEDLLARVKSGLPEMPEVRAGRYQTELGLPAYDAGVLTEDRGLADYFEATLAALSASPSEAEAKAASNFVMGEVLRLLNERSLPAAECPVQPGRLAALIRLRLDDAISSTGAQELFGMMVEDPAEPQALAERANLLQVSDTGALEPIVQAVVDENPKQVETYLGGKQGLIGFFIGQVMRRFDGSPDPKLVRKLLAEALESRR